MISIGLAYEMRRNRSSSSPRSASNSSDTSRSAIVGAKNGFLNCIKANYPNLKVVEYATKWDTPTAVNDAKTALSTYSDLKGIYVHWSGPVPGIIAAEKAAGKFTKVGTANHIVLFSDDGTPQEHGWIRQGELDAHKVMHEYMGETV